jgi:hypothetical protein
MKLTEISNPTNAKKIAKGNRLKKNIITLEVTKNIAYCLESLRVCPATKITKKPYTKTKYPS